MPREELKVNIIIRGDKIFLGAQATDCDPKMTTLTGNLQNALELIPNFIEQANREWDVSARNPKVPEPVVAAPAPRVATTSASKPAAAAKPAPAQPKFF
ncbi:MAG: hypothetical protein Q8O16_04100 [Dehalococcoidia bacterium]|nr:hypothetical protein [Dehalococcoidia bacterium]